MASSAKSLDEMIQILGDGPLNELEKAQIELLQKDIDDHADLIDKARSGPSAFTVREKAELARLANALGRIREIRTKAFNRLFGIES